MTPDASAIIAIDHHGAKPMIRKLWTMTTTAQM